jgi:Spy/CpxP family protein refolding chaperone
MDANQGSRKALLLVFVLFVLGIALGCVGTYVVTTRVLAARPQATLAHSPGHAMEMFTRDLNLNPEQQNQIQAILNDTRGRYAELHEKLDPEYEQVRHEGRQRIREVLTPEQRPKFEELLRQIDEDRRKRQAAPDGHD